MYRGARKRWPTGRVEEKVRVELCAYTNMACLLLVVNRGERYDIIMTRGISREQKRAGTTMTVSIDKSAFPAHRRSLDDKRRRASMAVDLFR